MHIPYIVFIIILVVLAFWLDKQKRDAKNEFEETLSAERQRAHQLSEQQFEHHQKEIEDLTIAVISATFDCGFYDAYDKYKILKRTYNDTDFVNSMSNIRRKQIFEKALAEYNQGKDIPQ